MYGIKINKMKNPNFATSLQEIIDVLCDARKYNWLLSNYECPSIYPPEQIPRDLDFVWLTGDELVCNLADDPPFHWCVATAYAKNILKEDVLQHPLPVADGCEVFWQPEIALQNPLAEIEIIMWDASYVFILSKSQMIIDEYAKEYPVSEDLATYNRRNPYKG